MRKISVTLQWFCFAMILVVILSGCSRPVLRDIQDEPLQTELSPVESPTTNPIQISQATSIPGTASQPLCDSTQQEYYTGFDIVQEPELAEPVPRVFFRDPVFGSCLVRVTDRESDLAEGDESAGLKNEYSRVQSFNAGNTMILVRGIGGTWYVYDAQALQPLAQLPLDIDPRWGVSQPGLIYYANETRLMSFNVLSGEQLTVHDFAGDLPGQNIVMVWTRYEGSPSFDGRYWGLMAEDENWLAAAYLVYDLHENRVISMLDVRGLPEDARESDSVTISPKGNYFLVYMDKYCEPGQLGTEDQPCGLMVYDRDLKNGRGLLRLAGHSDTAIDAQGREVLVYQDIDTDQVSMLDLASGEITALWPIDFSHTPIGLHISGRASLRPGWAVISTHDGDPASYTWMDDQVFAIELKPGGRIVRFAHTHSQVDENQEHDYWAEPHASPNQDLTRILFTSNWEKSGTGEVEMYMITLPEDWLVKLP